MAHQSKRGHECTRKRRKSAGRRTSIILSNSIICTSILLSPSFLRKDDGFSVLAFGTSSFSVRHERRDPTLTHIQHERKTCLELSHQQDQSVSFFENNNDYDQVEYEPFNFMSKEDLHFQIQNWFTLNQQQSDYGTSILSYQHKLLRQVNEMHAQDVSFCSSILFPEKQTQQQQYSGDCVDHEWVNISMDGKYHPDSLNLIQKQQQYKDSWGKYQNNPVIRGPNSDYLQTLGNDKNVNQFIRLASKTKIPVCSETCIQLLRQTANSHWSSSSTEAKKSSFSYQRRGNYEAHLHELCKSNQDLQHEINRALETTIYPWVRNAFRDAIPELAYSSDDNDYDLAIYDALVIRYNATEALGLPHRGNVANDYISNDKNRKGAGQPLHRDLGLISVNIMLNSKSEFVGGGTCFDLQYDPNFKNEHSEYQNLKPNGVGYALAHLSSHRHAGSCITQGVREILVLFLTAKKSTKTHQNNDGGGDDFSDDAPTFEKVSRLKKTASNRNKNSIPSIDQNNRPELSYRRVHHYFLATKLSPNDGEAWHYLGMSLKEHASSNENLKKKYDTLILALQCLQHATLLIPCDARLFNNLGLLYQQLSKVNHIKVQSCFERSMELHEWSERAGCDVEEDYDSACLNFGVYLSYLVDEESDLEKQMILSQNCINVLRTRFARYQTIADTDIVSNIQLSGSKLLTFCEQQQRILMLQ